MAGPSYTSEPQTERTLGALAAIPSSKEAVPYPTHLDVVARLGAFNALAFQTTYEVQPTTPVQDIPLPFDPARVFILNPKNNQSYEQFAGLDCTLSHSMTQRKLYGGDLVVLGQRKCSVDMSGPIAADPGDILFVLAEGYNANGGEKLITGMAPPPPPS